MLLGGAGRAWTLLIGGMFAGFCGLTTAACSPTPRETAESSDGGASGGQASGGQASGGLGAAPNAGGEGGALAEDDEDVLFFPSGIPNTPLSAAGSLELVAFTLEATPSGVVYYAAARNRGDKPACGSGIVVHFYDAADELLGTQGATLRTSGLYLLDAMTGEGVWCVPPGEVGMVASAPLPELVALREVARLEHSLPTFILGDLTALEGLGVTELRALERPDGWVYAGTLSNGLPSALDAAEVTVFSVNPLGRPVGAARSVKSAPTVLDAGTSWDFETEPLAQRGSSAVAFPSGTLAPSGEEEP